jgi:hypothetical protein
MKKNTPIELPFVVSVRFSEADFRRLQALSEAQRRPISQMLRLLLEPALRDHQRTA